jgi:hypothetical protein
MAKRLRLNPRQLDVLTWIAEGHPEGVMKDFTYKTVGLALQSRRLVTVSKRRGVWSALLTSDGSYYLEHSDYPDGTVAPGSRARPKPKQIDGDGLGSALRTSAATDDRDRPSRKAPPPPKTLAPTEQLIADLLANDGEVRIGHLDAAKYEARVSAAIRFGKVPEGMQLVTEGDRWSREYVVRLRDAPSWLNAVLEPVQIPATLRSPHPLVAALQQPNQLRGIDRSARQRVLLMVQALAVESSRRGYSLKATEVETDRYGYRRSDSNDHFSIAVGPNRFGIEIRQSVDRVPHEPTKSELRDAERYSWSRIPKFDTRPGDRLNLHLSGLHEHRQSKWSDSAAHQLEKYLPQILQEVELRAEAAEQARIAAIAAAEERRRQWEKAMEQAKVDHRETALGRELDAQIDEWLRANQGRSYLAAMESRIGAMEPSEAAKARRWFDWAARRVAALDPLRRPLEMPVLRDPVPSDLTEFLHGWNPYGP